MAERRGGGGRAERGREKERGLRREGRGAVGGELYGGTIATLLRGARYCETVCWQLSVDLCDLIGWDGVASAAGRGALLLSLRRPRRR
eukprot:1421401-Rhodomonas_salina.1